MALTSDPHFTSFVHDYVEKFSTDDRLLVVGDGDEERSAWWEALRASVPDRVIKLREMPEVNLALVEMDSATFELHLRQPNAFGPLLRHGCTRQVDIDLTSLPTHIWAPIVKYLWSNSLPARALYVEPANYTLSSAPTEGTIFDLSERIRGLSPLPGFAQVSRMDDGEGLLVALLGFEGARFAHLIENIEPKSESVFPIVGAPGFKLQYPFHAFLGNRPAIEQVGCATNVHFAQANCPFSAYYAIRDISRKRRGTSIQVAPIGTKPHALGAILFALANHEFVEVVYDHPIRRAGRTTGSTRCCVYNISEFQRHIEST